MFKVIGPGVARIIFAVFMLGVFILMLLLTGGSLEKIFPNDLIRQAAGYLLFDIGAVVWLIIMVKGSRGMMQRGIAFVVFCLDVLGTIGMAGAAAFMSGQELVETDPRIAEGIIWIFIAAAAVNLIGLYAHHLFDMETDAEVRSQNHVDKLKQTAMDKADKRIEEQADVLSERLTVAYFDQASGEIEQLVAGMAVRRSRRGPNIIEAQYKEVPQNQEPVTAFNAEAEQVEANPTTPASRRAAKKA